MNMSIVPAADSSTHHDVLLRGVLATLPCIVLSQPEEPGRAEVEHYVTQKFQAVWQARVDTFMPWLLWMHCAGHCCAVAGIRDASTGNLFLEQYLDEPVELVLGHVLGTPVSRHHIAEIGNLVADQRGSSHLLFLVVAAALQGAGYRWIVFTATRSLRNNLDKLGFPTHLLAVADVARLDPGLGCAWGTYYSSDPQVLAGSLDEALKIAGERPLLRRVLRLYSERVAALSRRLRNNA